MSSVNLIWEDKKNLLINDVRFFVTWDPNELKQVESHFHKSRRDHRKER